MRPGRDHRVRMPVHDLPGVVLSMGERPGLWNIAVILVSSALLVTLVGYAFLESFTYRP